MKKTLVFRLFLLGQVLSISAFAGAGSNFKLSERLRVLQELQPVELDRKTDEFLNSFEFLQTLDEEEVFQIFVIADQIQNEIGLKIKEKTLAAVQVVDRCEQTKIREKTDLLFKARGYKHLEKEMSNLEENFSEMYVHQICKMRQKRLLALRKFISLEQKRVFEDAVSDVAHEILSYILARFNQWIPSKTHSNFNITLIADEFVQNRGYISLGDITRRLGALAKGLRFIADPNMIRVQINSGLKSENNLNRNLDGLDPVHSGHFDFESQFTQLQDTCKSQLDYLTLVLSDLAGNPEFCISRNDLERAKVFEAAFTLSNETKFALTGFTAEVFKRILYFLNSGQIEYDESYKISEILKAYLKWDFSGLDNKINDFLDSFEILNSLDENEASEILIIADQIRNETGQKIKEKTRANLLVLDRFHKTRIQEKTDRILTARGYEKLRIEGVKMQECFSEVYVNHISKMRRILKNKISPIPAPEYDAHLKEAIEDIADKILSSTLSRFKTWVGSETGYTFQTNFLLNQIFQQNDFFNRNYDTEDFGEFGSDILKVLKAKSPQLDFYLSFPSSHLSIFAELKPSVGRW